MKNLKKSGFKSQILFFLIIAGTMGILMIGGAVYFLEVHQVKKNTSYLIQNATKQTASMLDDKLNVIFIQYNKITDKSSLWRLVNQSYEGEETTREYNDILECYQDMKELYYSYPDVIDSLYFKSGDGNSIPLYKDMFLEQKDVKWDSLFQDEYKGNFGYYWLNRHEEQIFRTQKPRYVISLIQSLKNIKEENTSFMVLNFKSDYIESLLQKTKVSKNGYMILLSPDGQLGGEEKEQKYQLSESDVEKILNREEQSTIYEMTGESNQEKLFVYCEMLQMNGWTLISVVPEEDLLSSMKQFLPVLIGIIVSLFFLAIVFFMISAGKITKPIERLTSQVVEFQTNRDICFDAGENAGYEVKILSSGLTKLKKRVEELLYQVKKEQEEKMKLELLILQEQIKPHFLYNTLASIKQLISMGENVKAEDMCEALSRFYRIGLSDGKDFITIKEETEHVKNYLLIQRYRYHTNFDYSINISEKILDEKLLKLSLQPLVENAIYHGIKKKDGYGTIVISGYEKNGYIYLEVFDDGAGMTENQVMELEKTVNKCELEENVKHFGLSNVNHRLKLYFGEEARLEFESTEGMYTQVTMILPKGENHA